MRITSTSLLTLSLLMPVIACDDDTKEPASQSLVDVASNAGDFTILVGALQATGLDATLSGDESFTVFAPTDAAFERLPAGVLDSLDAETLTTILTYHVVPGTVEASTVVTLSSATTVEGADVAIRLDGSTVVINGTTQVTDTDIAADNGVIHVLDSVLLPPDIAFPGTVVDAALAYPIFGTLAGAVVTAELAEALSSDNSGMGFTVFAPQDNAFTALGVDLATLSTEELADILLYHTVDGEVDAATVVGLTEATTKQGSDVSIVVDDSGVTLNGSAKVVRTDLRTTNGIIHVIDGVLVPAN